MNARPSLFGVAELAPDADELTAMRRHLHANPELSFEEAGTAAFVAERLVQYGYDVTTGVGGHGVVATLKNGDGARKLAIRADMDALPIREETGKQWASRRIGAMHACGHDGHTTTLLGAAQYLARTKRFNGTLHLVFQPAEEVGGMETGAQKMIADGLFERFPCDAIFGLHNHPGAPAGTLMFRPGPFMSASDTVRITIHGRGGHAARPQHTVDPVVIASSLVLAFQTIVARNVDPNDTAVVTVGAIHAGDAPNVIPDHASLALSVRSFNADVRALLEKRIRQLVVSLTEAHGATADIDYAHGSPVLVNTDAETRFAQQVAEELVGAENVVAPHPLVTGSEDFAYYLQHKPGCFLRIGNGPGAPLHNARYDFSDEILLVGAAFWARLAERYLA